MGLISFCDVDIRVRQWGGGQTRERETVSLKFIFGREGSSPKNQDSHRTSN